jgi:hypothetical protein
MPNFCANTLTISGTAIEMEAVYRKMGITPFSDAPKEIPFKRAKICHHDSVSDCQVLPGVIWEDSILPFLDDMAFTSTRICDTHFFRWTSPALTTRYLPYYNKKIKSATDLLLLPNGSDHCGYQTPFKVFEDQLPSYAELPWLFESVVLTQTPETFRIAFGTP